MGGRRIIANVRASPLKLLLYSNMYRVLLMVKWGLLKSNMRPRGQVQATFNITFYTAAGQIHSRSDGFKIATLWMKPPHVCKHHTWFCNNIFKHLYWESVSVHLLIIPPIETRSLIFATSHAVIFFNLKPWNKFCINKYVKVPYIKGYFNGFLLFFKYSKLDLNLNLNLCKYLFHCIKRQVVTITKGFITSEEIWKRMILLKFMSRTLS